MPSREFNQRLWTRFDWSSGGEQWSAPWGETRTLWYGTLMPRIGAFLGNVRAVELGPGFGRITAYLKEHCASLVLVDLAPNCIDACEKRFAGAKHLRYFVNDGARLPFIEDGSVDFIFSFDSLVHADLSTIRSYLVEIERVLAVGGAAVLHHSNAAAVLLDMDAAPGGAGVHLHMRARDVSADRILEASDALGSLECRVQEIISWDATSVPLDCISTFVRVPRRSTDRPDRAVNADFHRRALELRDISRRYARHARETQGPGSGELLPGGNTDLSPADESKHQAAKPAVWGA